jgi:para-nitrobenzyl esterase
VGAAHAVDLPFTFATFAADGWAEFVGATGERESQARAVSDAMQQSWVRFAADGDPGWPRWSVPERPTMVLGDSIGVERDPIGVRAALWS